MSSDRNRRPGKHARNVMSDRRYSLLPLAARACWIGLTDVADVIPSVRSPVGGNAMTVADMARYLATDTTDIEAAIAPLLSCGVLEPIGSGYRLKSY